MMRRGWVGILGVAAAIASPAAAANGIRGGVVGNGATPTTGSAAAGKVLYGTVGQPMVGSAAGSSHRVGDGFWSFGGVRVVTVGDGPKLPTVLELGLPSPNPTNGAVALSLAVPGAADVRIDVLDVQGRVVGAMHAGRLEAGRHRFTWDGTDGAGRPSPSGVYFAVLVVDGRRVAERRLVRLL